MSRRISPRGRASVRVLLIAVLFLVIAGAVTTWVVLRRYGPESAGAGSAPGVSRGERLSVGFLTLGDASDLTFNYQHFQGRHALAALLRDRVDIDGVHVVPDPAAAGAALEKLCDRGVRLIISGAPEHGAATLEAAERHPEVRFLQFLGDRRRPNLSPYGMRDWEPSYVCGVVAALSARGARHLGFVGPAAPPTHWVANAFTLGARSVDPEITVEVVSTGDWYAPRREEEAVERLAVRGVGAIYFLTISPVAGLRAASSAGIHGLTHFSDLSFVASRRWLTGGVWRWAPLYEEVARQVLDGAWEARHHEVGFREGCIALAPFGAPVEASVRERAREVVRQIAGGELEIYAGPLHDREGNLRVPAGQVLTAREVRSVDWFVQGVR